MTRKKHYTSSFTRKLIGAAFFSFAIVFLMTMLDGCSKQPKQQAREAEVTVTTIKQADTPMAFEFVAQTQSSHEVQIRGRVSGFLEKKVYTEGTVVKKGSTLFVMDKKPFQAQVNAAAAALSRQRSNHETARRNLERVKPLAEQNALSQKDLDDAKRNFETTAAEVEQAEAQLEMQQLDLSYCTITSPITGITGVALIQDGAYVNPQNNHLTTVSVLSPMWVNFSISENDVKRYADRIAAGQVIPPKNENYEVEIILVDGSVFSEKGSITFAAPSFDPKTGTFMLRSSFKNAKGYLRPNQYVRARMKGAIRRNAVLVPQRTVQQGAKGHFVWVVNREGKAEFRPVTIGDWYGNDIFIDAGLHSGDRVVVEGVLGVRQGEPVKIKQAAAGQPVGRPGESPAVKVELTSSKPATKPEALPGPAKNTPQPTEKPGPEKPSAKPAPAGANVGPTQEK